MIYEEYFLGDQKTNMEKALWHFNAALQIYTLEIFPTHNALIHNNLGIVLEDVLQVIVPTTFNKRLFPMKQPYRYTHKRIILPSTLWFRTIWVQCIVNILHSNVLRNWNELPHAIEQTLQVYTHRAFPAEYRLTQLSLAETEAEQGNWHNAHVCYVAAWSAEQMLIALGTGAVGRDAILKDGREAAARNSFVLTRIGKVEEAAVTIERGRARGLAEAFSLNIADPTIIKDVQRRECYIVARQQLIDAQAALNTLSSRGFTESAWRHIQLEQITACSKAQTTSML